MWQVSMRAAVLIVFLATGAGSAFAQITSRTNVTYGDLPRQTLDIYVPESVSPQTPIVVFFHGGAWRTGDKSQLKLLGQRFAEAGIILVAPNYRLRPAAAFPDFVKDSALATAFAWRELRTPSGGPRPLFLGGQTTGAYNAAMVALNQDYLAEEGVPADAVTGFFGVAGPYDGGYCAGSRCKSVFPDETREQWHIANFVDRNDPPMLLIAAGNDKIVPISDRDTLAAAAKAAGVEVTTLVVPDVSNMFLFGELCATSSPVRDAVDSFIAAQMQDG